MFQRPTVPKPSGRGSRAAWTLCPLIVFSLCSTAYSQPREPGHDCPIHLAPDSLPTQRPVSYTLTEGQARLAIKSKIDADNYGYQVDQLRQAGSKKDTLINDLRWERDWYKRSVEQDAIISARHQRRIAQQNKELWIYRSGLLVTLFKIFVK